MSDVRIVGSGSNPGVAAVDEKGRVSALSIGKQISEYASERGESFNFNTGIITLTTGKSAVAYIKNNTSDKIAIQTVGYLFGNSNGGAAPDNIITEVVRNPTGGTIIANEVVADVFVNKNFSSNKSFTQDQLPRYKGVQGDTLTGGESAFPSLLPSAARQYLIATGQITLEPGASLGINITPQASNVSMDVMVFMAIVDLASVISAE